MGRTFAYMRISTEEERKKQKFTRQKFAVARWAKEHGIEIPQRKIYKDDKSGKSFEHPQWLWSQSQTYSREAQQS